MKRKILCLILAFCCFSAAGCNKVEKETLSDYPDSTTSTVLPDNPFGNQDTYISSSNPTDPHSSSSSSIQSTSGTTGSEQISSTAKNEQIPNTSSSDQETSSSNSTGDYRSPNSSSVFSSSSSSSKPQSSSASGSSSSASKPQSSVTQSSKPQSSAVQSSTSSGSSGSSQHQYSQTSLPNELIPPQNTGIIGNYNQRPPENWEIEYANEVFRLTNIERVKEGLPELKQTNNLDAAANIRAWEVLVDYSHTRPNGEKFSTVLTEVGVKWQLCGENIAAGQRTPEDVVKAWMNSTSHRANILDPRYEYLGVGFYYDYDQTGGTDYRYFWAQNFFQ